MDIKETDFDFDSAKVYCENVKVNTRGYIYLKSYPGLLEIANFIKADNSDKKHKIFAMAVAAYGWMPRIPEKFDDIILENIKIDELCEISSDKEAIEFLQQSDTPIINTWVGTSKFLHFMHPDHFPIWDSRIAKVINCNQSGNSVPNINSYYMGKKINYITYAKKMINFKGKQIKGLDKFRSDFEKLFAYKPSEIRSLEMALFFKSSKE